MEERPDDRELVQRCRAGSHEAFRELVDRYKHLVFGMIPRTLADRNRVEDLAQEVFLRVHRGLPYFRGEASLSTWICRIAINVCAAERRSSEVPLDDHQPPSSVDRAFSDLELRDRINKALARLPDHARELITLHYFAGRRYEDIAAALGIPLGTVKVQLHRAKIQLRELLSADIEVDGR